MDQGSFEGVGGLKIFTRSWHPADGKPRLNEALQRLVQLYEATGRTDKAAEWKKRLDAPATSQAGLQ